MCLNPLILLSLFRPKTGSALVFGLCVPAACSMDFLQDHFKINQINNENVSIKLLEDSCQLEESVSTWTSIDWFTA